jgi:hypothetical protein
MRLKEQTIQKERVDIIGSYEKESSYVTNYYQILDNGKSEEINNIYRH